jgi:hypothetical protein
MNREDLLEAIGIADETMLEASEKRTKRKWIMSAAAAAACFTLCIGIWLLRIPPKPLHPTLCLTAEMIQNETRYYQGTNKYVVHYTYDLAQESLYFTEHQDYLPVYRVVDWEADRERTEAFIEKLSPGLEKVFDLTIPQVILEKNTVEENQQSHDTYKFTVDEGEMHIFFSAWEDGMRANCWNTNQALRINGETVSVQWSDSDEAILEALSTLQTEFSELFGVTYDGIRLERDLKSEFINVYLYEKANCKIIENREMWPEQYIVLQFSESGMYSTGAPVEELFLVQMQIYQHTRNWEEEKCVMLTIKEAKKLLKKGYVFSGHSCPRCEANQDNVDFLDYDAVAIEYQMRDTGYVVPFYAFYKYLKTDEKGVRQYAKTMVPAVRVEGLKEYFQEQTKYHS